MTAVMPVMIITGGAQGIGKGIAIHFLDRGWRATAADIDGEAGEELMTEQAHRGDRLIFVETDVGDDAAASRCVRRTLDRFGRIDALINNAGIPNQHYGSLNTSLERWDRLIRTNLTGPFIMCRHAAPHMKLGGSIVNIASTRALQSEPESEAYAASKGGLVALTHAMAITLGPRIRVNCISPGWISVSEWKKSQNRSSPNLGKDAHAMHPAGRVGTPEDVAAMVDYLVSDAAGFVTGQNFVIDGGMTKKMVYK